MANSVDHDQTALHRAVITEQGPVVQSFISLMTLLMTNLLTVVAKVCSNTLVILLQKCEQLLLQLSLLLLVLIIALFMKKLCLINYSNTPRLYSQWLNSVIYYAINHWAETRDPIWRLSDNISTHC